MAILNDTIGTAGYIVSEANGYRSREQVTVDATGGALIPGTVLGTVTASGNYVAHDAGASDGSENASAVLLSAMGAVEGSGTITARDSEVNEDELTFADGISEADKTAALAALAALGIVTRKEA